MKILQLFNSSTRNFGFGETRTICYENEPNLGDTANTLLQAIETDSTYSEEGVDKMKKEISSSLLIWKNNTGEEFPLSNAETAVIKSQNIEDSNYTRRALQSILGKILGDLINFAQETDNATNGSTAAEPSNEEKIISSKKMMEKFPGSQKLASRYGRYFVSPKNANEKYNELKEFLKDISPDSLYANVRIEEIKAEMKKCSPEYIKKHYSEIDGEELSPQLKDIFTASTYLSTDQNNPVTMTSFEYDKRNPLAQKLFYELFYRFNNNYISFDSIENAESFVKEVAEEVIAEFKEIS